ncbi:MAG: GGDEF domain-containing protein [Rhodospirillales bacterium]|nr:GGDEF domain-containing protein [Rhodospirillales bacterium]
MEQATQAAYSVLTQAEGPVERKFAARENPSRLLGLFAILSVLSVAMILALSGIGFHRVIQNEMMTVAEEKAHQFANAIFAQERATLLHHDKGRPVIAVAEADFAALDKRMKQTLINFDMYKIKAFSADRTIVYSTDHKIIGKVEDLNDKLAEVIVRDTVVSVLEHKESVRDLAGEERFNIDVVECYIPIKVGPSVVGAFEVYVEVTSTHARIERALKGSLAILAGVLVVVFALLFLPLRRGMIGLKSAQDYLRELASIDTLTGVFNRRHLLNRVQEEQARLRRTAGKAVAPVVSFLMIDIDHFKKINDTYGHLGGDQVLRQVTHRLKKCLRQYDVLGRYGGEEFLVMLPNTRLDQALVVAERMRHAVCGTPTPLEDGQGATVSVSIGVSTVTDHGQDIAAAIARADDGLYRAKNNGRNQVCALDDTARLDAQAAPIAGALPQIS